jgi:hypothetical protein
MRLPHAIVDLNLCQPRVFPSPGEAFSKSAVCPLVCLVLRIHSFAGISNLLAIPQNGELSRSDWNWAGPFYSGGVPKKDTGLR